ncbi:carboxypeptidase regulatory-like domain-containing protein [Candidatus Woesearchaeota archaeon]|nr:carboxypeptidase regulatory-like domain-containing protein [Candidatus Woesearchaeota archaeon]
MRFVLDNGFLKVGMFLIFFLVSAFFVSATNECPGSQYCTYEGAGSTNYQCTADSYTACNDNQKCVATQAVPGTTYCFPTGLPAGVSSGGPCYRYACQDCPAGYVGSGTSCVPKPPDDCNDGGVTCVNPTSKCCLVSGNYDCYQCCANSDCGSAGCGSWGSNYCSGSGSGSSVKRDRTCTNPACNSGSCAANSYTDTQIVQECGTDSCGAYGSDYCSGSGGDNTNKVHSRDCTTISCSSATCSSETNSEVAVVQDCGDTSSSSTLTCTGSVLTNTSIVTHRGCSSASCYTNPVNTTTTTDCAALPSTDSDGSFSAFEVGGVVEDYLSCSAGACTLASYADSCAGTVLTEYGVDGASHKSQTYDCQNNETAYCNATGGYFRDEWRCSGAPGFCNNGAVDTHIGTNVDGDQWDEECGDSVCRLVNGMKDSMILPEDNGAACSDGVDNDCDGLVDCVDPDCAGLAGAGGTCCQDASVDCVQAECVDEQCVANVCSYSPRPVCDGSDCADGFFCDALGSCVDADSDQTVCTTCVSGEWAYGNESAGFGGYIPTGREGPECCGNNVDENFVTIPAPRSGCCNAPTDCIDELGMCRVGHEDDAALCTDGIDNDCDGVVDSADESCYGDVSGIVWDGDNIALGYVVSGAVINGKPPGLPAGLEVSAVSDGDGDYLISHAFVGTYQFRASEPKVFEDSVVTVTVLSDQVVSQDFYLYREPSCDENCLDANGYCNFNCNGTSFPSGESCEFSHKDCWGRTADSTISFVEGEVRTVYQCCEGPVWTEAAPKAKVTASTKNMYDYKRLVTLNGRKVWMHVLVWSSE